MTTTTTKGAAIAAILVLFDLGVAVSSDAAVRQDYDSRIGGELADVFLIKNLDMLVTRVFLVCSCCDDISSRNGGRG